MEERIDPRTQPPAFPLLTYAHTSTNAIHTHTFIEMHVNTQVHILLEVDHIKLPPLNKTQLSHCSVLGVTCLLNKIVVSMVAAMLYIPLCPSAAPA